MNTADLKTHKLALLLAAFHIIIVASSNYLIQFPVNILGYTTTWGTFTFPFIFLATDLTVRLFGAHLGRRIIFYAMIPALVISYLFSAAFRDGHWLGIAALHTFDVFVARIAIASFSAYVIGQVLDIFVFNKLRRHKQWWHAPAASAFVGNLVDTFTFYMIAFYKTSDPFMAENGVEVATVDYIFKLSVNLIFFLPLYKVILDQVLIRFKKIA